MIHETRVHELNDRPIEAKRRYVLYWMQQSQRTRCNHALEYAIDLANELDRPLVVCFGLMDDYPHANARHYAFLLEGLRDVQANLAKRDITFVVRHGQAFDAALHYGKDACAIVCDRGYLRHLRAWRDRVADAATCRVIQVESDVVVPIDVVSDKHEYAARTIRPKIHKHLDAYLQPLRAKRVKHGSTRLQVAGDIDVSDPIAALKRLKVDRSVGPSPVHHGGEDVAARKLKRFLTHELVGYDDGRNEPVKAWSSMQSMHLHFGQIAPLELALAVRDAAAPQADRDAYLEELIVRRELSMNFVEHVSCYDEYECLPDWAKKTLAEHGKDARERIYSRDEMEHAQTNDPYWNAAQRQMTLTGFMHNYMRMYWGKRILGWSKTPEQAFETALYLNDKYFLDGRDANGYANVAWIFGVHDRPWGPARKVFGTVRYMNAAGLERKFDIDAYVRSIDDLARELA